MAENTELAASVQNIQQALASIDQLNAQQLNQIGAQLNELWTRAESARDQRSMTLINDAWNVAQALASNAVELGAQVAGLTELAVSLDVQRETVVKEYDELMEAIYDIDTDHPALADFADSVTQQTEEYMVEYADEVAWEQVHDEVYQHLHDLLKPFGFDYMTIANFKSALFNEGVTWSEHQLALLATLVKTFESHYVPIDLDADPEDE